MATIQFEQDYSDEELRKWVKAVQPLQRGQYPIHPFEFDRQEGTLTIDRNAVEQLFLEHQQYNDAKGFSPTKLMILRVIEYNDSKEGNDVISLGEIQERLAEEHDTEREKPTISQHLRELIANGLIERIGSSTSGIYGYTGPRFAWEK